MAEVVIPYVLAGAAVAGYAEQRKAGRESRRASAIQRRLEEAQNLRERRRLVAARQRAEAQAAAAGASSGMAPGSGVVAAEQASIGSQFGANLGFAGELEQLGKQRASFLESAAEHEERALTFQAAGQAVSGGFSAYQQGKKQ